MLPQLNKLGFGNFTVIRKSDGHKMGTCGLYDRDGLEGLDLGFAFLPRYESKGYGYESAQRVLRFAFEELEVTSIQAITVKENLRSQKLLARLGMKCEGSVKLPGGNEVLLHYTIKKAVVKG
jgi:RimJ/RimL family protein N-acetyltransferase